MASSDPIPAALARVDGAAAVALAAELVRIPSHPGLERQEEGVARALARWLEARGLAPRLDEVAPGRPNLLCTLRGARPGRRLILCGHTDTVPLNADGAGHGFSGDVVDGWLRGRGSVDMKGPLAAMAAALVALDGALPAGEVTLAAVADEEMESIGAEHLVRSGLVADGAVVGEPTGNRIALGHKGLEWLQVEFTGRAAHGGTPERGINAIVAAARFVALVEARLQPRLAARAHPRLGPPTLNFGTVQGGDQPSTVAARCRLALDRRTVPEESYERVIGELVDLLHEVEAAMPGLTSRLGRMPGGMATMAHVALDTPPDHPLAQAAAAARERVIGARGEFTSFPAWTDGALLAGFAHVPTIVLGPGDLALAHAPAEAIPVAELEAAARVFAALAVEFCAGA